MKQVEKESAVLGWFLLIGFILVVTLILITLFYEVGYRNGQIDAAFGNQRYGVITHKNGFKELYENKK